METIVECGRFYSVIHPRTSYPWKYEMYLQVLICRWQSVSCHQGEQPGILHWRCNHHVPHGHWSWRMNNHLWRHNCTCTLGGGQGRQVQQSMLEVLRGQRKLLRKELKRGEPEKGTNHQPLFLGNWGSLSDTFISEVLRYYFFDDFFNRKVLLHAYALAAILCINHCIKQSCFVCFLIFLNTQLL